MTETFQAPAFLKSGLLSGFSLLASALLLNALVFPASSPAQSQADSPHGTTRVVNQSNTALGRSRTPQQVLNGTAKPVGRYAPDAKIRLALGLNPPNLEQEEAFLKDLQDRTSPGFHKYLTAAQWNTRFAPSESDEQSVVDWATTNGLTITRRYPNRLIVDVEAPSATIEKAFGVTINSYQVAGNVEYSNDHDPVIPTQLLAILHSVGGLNSIQRLHAPHEGNIRSQSPLYSPGDVVQVGASSHKDGDKKAFDAAMKASAAKKEAHSDTLKLMAKSSKTIDGVSSATGVTPAVTDGLIDPTDIYSSYGYDYNALQAQGHCCNPTGNAGGTPPNTSIGIATAGAFAGSDIAGFQGRYSYLAYNYGLIYIDGTPGCCNDETTLDTEWAIATSNSFGSYETTAGIHVYEGVNTLLSTFTDIYQEMLNEGVARVFSTSWGCEEFVCTDGGTMDSDHAIFNSMVGQGWTMMAATGDQGAVAGCGDGLAIQYPSSDPDIVAVGGTTLSLNDDGTLYSETGWGGDTYSGACAANDGGSTGGCSAKYAAPGYQTDPFCGSTGRSVPDISLNAGAGQNVYFDGTWYGFGGTSIATPMVAGFMAQANAYLTAIGLGGAPIGNANYMIYYAAHNPTYAAHYPFYDAITGCNTNDITLEFGLGGYCAVAGYDRVTGWGSFNALQFSWFINAYFLGDFVAPTVTFTGPPTGVWYNTDKTVSWIVTDAGETGLTSTGVGGFSQAWDAAFSDPTTEATQGIGNSFYSGPQFPNATTGYLDLANAGQGCHYATVDAWDNSGYTSGNQYYYYVCYDTVAPTVSSVISPAPDSSGWDKASVKVSLAATDPGAAAASGILKTYYGSTSACKSTSIASCAVYSAPLSYSAQGSTPLYYFTEDVAGNFSSQQLRKVMIDEVAPVTTAALSGTLHGTSYDTDVKVTLTATDAVSGVLSTHYILDGGTVLAYTAPFTVTAAGAHTVKYYSEDKADNTEATRTVTFTIDSPTKTTLSATPNPSLLKEAVTIKATVAATLSGTPTGTVTFKAGSTTLGTGTLAGGVATLSTTALPLGNVSLTAAYGGAAAFTASTSAAYTQVVHESTTSKVTASANPSVFGATIAFTARVTPLVSGIPTGTVQFHDSGTLLGSATLSNGVGTFSTHALAAGSHSITVTYLGSTTYAASTSSAVDEVVDKAASVSTVTSSLHPSTFGMAVTFTCKVTSTAGVPTGTITFKNNGTTLGTKTLSGGVATFETSILTVGTHSITLTYAASTDYNTSTSSALSQVVNKAVTTSTVASSLHPSAYGQAVTFTAKVSSAAGVPAGTVTFKDGATTLGSKTLSSGSATFETSTLSVATHSITAVYTTSTDFNASTSSALSQVVAKAKTTASVKSSLNPSDHGQAVTFTATVSAASGPRPTGNVTFKNGSTTLGTAALNTSGIATYKTTSLTSGSHSITAVYIGSTDDLAVTSAVLNQKVN